MRLFAAVTLTAMGTFILVRLLAVLAIRFTGVPKGFPPFTTLPLFSGVLGGFLCASAVYGLIRLVFAQPNRDFLFVSLATLALSFGLPLRLSFTRLPRFSGVTPAAQMTLALMHTVIATAVVTTLTRMGRLPR
jgi:hypothetical protein